MIKDDAIILALDVSGTATGFAVGQNNDLIDYGKFVSKSTSNRGKKLYEFAEWLEELFEKYEPDIVLIEKPYLGRNSNVLVSLSKFIAIVELEAYYILNLSLEKEWFLDPKRIKKLLSLSYPKHIKDHKKKYESNKRSMVKRINALYNMKLKYNKNKSKKYNDDDIADAIAILTAWWIIHED